MAQPNFIIFLTDDQGYGDLSCMGAPDFRTPHLDRLAADGARFTGWYSNSPVCSPSRESRNWLDGNQDPYYGGSAGGLKGHKFSLYEGGIRLPGIMHWPAVIPTGQVLDAPCASMDLFPTLLTAAGGEITQYEIDGTDLLPYVCDGQAPATRPIFWEQGNQTAVRRGDWKLVLQGQLIEGAPLEDDVHLSHVVDDRGEAQNLAEQEKAIAEELTAMAENWRQQIEARWQQEYESRKQGVTTYIPDPERTL